MACALYNAFEEIDFPEKVIKTRKSKMVNP